jgi:hypothetical protein
LAALAAWSASVLILDRHPARRAISRNANEQRAKQAPTGAAVAAGALTTAVAAPTIARDGDP